MTKTAVVAVTLKRFQAKYQKAYQVTRKFKAHNENNEYKTGDHVIIEETRPMSKEKRWRIVGVIAKNANKGGNNANLINL